MISRSTAASTLDDLFPLDSILLRKFCDKLLILEIWMLNEKFIEALVIYDPVYGVLL